MLHSVGFGKTVLAMSLILAHAESDAKWSQADRSPGLIRLKATLIFVPSQLTEQWKNETKDFLPDEFTKDSGVIVIRSIGDL